MELTTAIFCIFALSLTWTLTEGGVVEPCVTEGRTDLRECLNTLDTVIKDGEDICGLNGEEALQCVNTHLRDCPDLQEDDRLKAVLTAEVIRDISAVSSAENYCSCLKVGNYADNVDFDQISMMEPESPFDKVPNYSYICGTAMVEVLSVAQSMDACKTLIQARYPRITDNDTLTFRSLGTFAQKHCHLVNSDFDSNSECIMKRSRNHGYKRCVEMARTYKGDTAVSCGERVCIHQVMDTCEEEWQKFYIDAVNVFSDVSVPAKLCATSDAIGHTVSLVSVAVMIMSACLFHL